MKMKLEATHLIISTHHLNFKRDDIIIRRNIVNQNFQPGESKGLGCQTRRTTFKHI